MKKLGLFFVLIFLSFQTSAFGHDGENELERKKIFYGIGNYDVITISQPGVLYYSVTNQIIESVKIAFANYFNDDIDSFQNSDIYIVAFKEKFGESPLYTHHTTSLIFNDPPYTLL